MATKMPVPKSMWKAHISAANRGPRPGKLRVQKPLKKPSQKVRW